MYPKDGLSESETDLTRFADAIRVLVGFASAFALTRFGGQVAQPTLHAASHRQESGAEIGWLGAAAPANILHNRRTP
jgi:hypothetical protein